MKYVDIEKIDTIKGKPLHKNESFHFKCHSKLACFNKCCQNLNLFLNPYDVICLKQALDISSDRFIDQYVDIVLKPDNFFADVLLKMSETGTHACIFLTESGCSVYHNRPDTCRMFPIEQGMFFDAKTQTSSLVHFFRPPEFCRGPSEDQTFLPQTWIKDQDAVMTNQMTAQWAQIKRLFQSNPWGQEGPNGPKGKMAFMAAYNMDSFRKFIFTSSFLKRFNVDNEILSAAQKDDTALMQLGFEWIKMFVWNIKGSAITPK